MFASKALNKANEKRIQTLRKKIAQLRDESRGLLQVMAKFPERCDDVNELINANDVKIKQIEQKISEYTDMESLNEDTESKLKTSIDLLDDIITNRTLSNGTIRLLVERIIVHQVDEKTLDIHFKLRGAFQTHVDLWEKFRKLDHEKQQSMPPELVLQVADMLQETTA